MSGPPLTQVFQEPKARGGTLQPPGDDSSADAEAVTSEPSCRRNEGRDCRASLLAVDWPAPPAAGHFTRLGDGSVQSACFSPGQRGQTVPSRAVAKLTIVEVPVVAVASAWQGAAQPTFGLPDETGAGGFLHA